MFGGGKSDRCDKQQEGRSEGRDEEMKWRKKMGKNLEDKGGKKREQEKKVGIKGGRSRSGLYGS